MNNSILVNIVEDDPSAIRHLEGLFQRYEQEKGASFTLASFENPLTFLSSYKKGADVIFFDIQMPQLSGMEAAKLIREKDPSVLIVFTTNLPQFAIQGYEVEAIDYMLKPIAYLPFSSLLSKIQRIVSQKQGKEILITSQEGTAKVLARDILYVESQNHKILYHTEKKIYEEWSSLKEVEKKLPPKEFFRCNNCYLVGLAHVDGVLGDSLTVKGETLYISRARKKDFMKALASFCEEGKP